MSERRALQLEINMLKDLGLHRHLVSMLAWCHNGDELALVMEFVRGGNLQEYLRSQRVYTYIHIRFNRTSLYMITPH